MYFYRFSKIGAKAERNTETMTNVLNNVIIYKYEKGVAFAIIIAFAFVQLFGMLSMAANVNSTFCQELWNSEMHWRERLAKHKYSVFAIICGVFFGNYLKIMFYGFKAKCLFIILLYVPFFISGPLIFLGIMVGATRTVRRIILHKGGDKVTIVTYHPIPRKATQTIPLNKVCIGQYKRFKTGYLAKLNKVVMKIFYFSD